MIESRDVRTPVRPADASAAVRGSTLELYGSRILDFLPLVDMGMGLQTDQPMRVALVRGYRRRGRFAVLAAPIALSVAGESRSASPADADAEPGERIWTADEADTALCLELQHGTLASLLGCEAQPTG